MSTRRFAPMSTRGAAAPGQAPDPLFAAALSGDEEARRKIREVFIAYKQNTAPPTIGDAAMPMDGAATQTMTIADMIRREQRIGGARYQWFAESNLDAGAKILLVVLAIISGVAMFYPYGLTAAGWTFVSPIFGFVLPAVLTLFYLLALALTLFDRRFFNANFRWILSSTMEPHYRISDRWFSLFNSLIGLLWNFAAFLLWLTFYLNNMNATSKSNLLGASGFVTEPYAGLAAISFFGYWSIIIVFFVTLYSNIASRENRDIMQRLTRLFHGKSLEDVIMDYEKKAVGGAEV